jgi:hypothetical protein
VVGAAVILACLATRASAADPIPLEGVRADSDLAWLFAPAVAPPGAYDVFRSSRPIAELAAELRRHDPAPRADAWRVLRSDPATAFGTEGRYDRGRLARLFVGRQVLVARGALGSDEELSSYTLVTPVPDRALSMLQNDTMVIVTHVARLTTAAPR